MYVCTYTKRILCTYIKEKLTGYFWDDTVGGQEKKTRQITNLGFLSIPIQSIQHKTFLNIK